MDRNSIAGRYIVFDVETPNARNDRISAIGVTVIENGAVTEEFYTLVNPETYFDSFNVQLTGITPEQAADAPVFPEVWKKIGPMLSSGIPVAHNAVFDLGVLGKCLKAYHIHWKTSVSYLCTVQIGRRLLPDISHRLNDMCAYYHIDLRHHQADSDSHACAEILLRYMENGRDLRRFLKNWYFGKPEAGPEPTEFISNSERTALPDVTEISKAASKNEEKTGQHRSVAEKGSAADSDRLKEMLQRLYGHAEFREGQREIIECLLAGRDAMCVMPTGSGKSVCYQIPALMLPGTTFVISPLISLMKDQVAALRGMGIAAACLNSSLAEDEYAETAYQAVSGAYKMLYVAPERLQSPAFSEMCLHMDISLVAVDEAHCISQWGQDFRPSYLKIPEFIRMLPQRPPVGAFTATATPRVKEDIRRHLELREPLYVTTGYDRPNLSFSVYEPKDRERMLLELLRDRFRQSGIVYCATRKSVEMIAQALETAGFPATRYHAGLDREERIRNQEDFLFDRKRVMVATNAFGMGIDKSNVSYVIHYNMPKSLEAYYQEAGRAGRDGGDADCILLYSGQDTVMARWLIEHGEENPDLTPEERANVRAQDEERLKRMVFYAKSRKCLRGDILRYFGEKAPERCGNCSNCVPDCEHRDLTVEAQMILSCVARTGQQLAESPLADLMKGTVPKNCPEGIDPASLTTFGLMAAESEERIREDIRILLDQGYLDRSADERGALSLNNQSREVLFRNRRVTVQRMRRSTAGGQENEDLFQALQRLRYEISAAEYIAASSLFSDSTLRDICRQLPRNRTQLAKVDGMGLFKAGRYGESILRLINRYVPEEENTSKDNKTAVSGGKTVKTHKPAAEGKKFAAYRDRVIADGNTDAYQSWTSAEDERLTREFGENHTLQEMADAHKRTRGAILNRLRKLNLT